MPLPPYARLRASVNGGAPQTGGIALTGGENVVLSADPAGNLGSFLFEILDFPPSGFPCPSGWSTDASGVYFCRPTNGIAPTFTVASATNFGKYMLRLTGNNRDNQGAKSIPVSQLVDESTALDVPSINNIHQIGKGEQSQFGDTWIRSLQAALRIIDAVPAAFEANAGYTFGGSAAPAVNTSKWPTRVGTYSSIATGSVVLRAFTATAFSWISQGAALATDSVLCVVTKNGFDTALTISIAASSPVNTPISDFAHSASFAQGEIIGVRLLQSGTTAQANWLSQWSVG